MPEHESFLNSENSAVVMVEAAKGEKGTTSSKVAEKYDITQQSASRVIRNLKTKGFLQKGERTKSQFYKPDYDGIAEYALSQVDHNYSGENLEKISNYLKEIYEEVFIYSSENTTLYDQLFPSAMLEIEQRIVEKQEILDRTEEDERDIQIDEEKLETARKSLDLIKEYLYSKKN